MTQAGADDQVLVRFSKYDGSRHWEFAMTRLGADEHGTWLQAPVGCELVRPGRRVRSSYSFVCLLPHEEHFVAAFHDRTPGIEPDVPSVYVDISTPPQWVSANEVTMVDLDLDVILGWDGVLILDDEDEFALHRVAFGYPDELVELAQHAADRVMDLVRHRLAPFGGTAERWLATARELPD